MTSHPNEDGPMPGVERILEALKARLEARMAKARAAHERAMAAAERRVAEAMRARERARAAAERRMDQGRPAREHRADPLRSIGAVRGRRKPPGGPNPGGMEGGEGVPAVPGPKPNPLAGAAAAAIE
jgi:hypothetical protein